MKPSVKTGIYAALVLLTAAALWYVLSNKTGPTNSSVHISKRKVGQSKITPQQSKTTSNSSDIESPLTIEPEKENDKNAAELVLKDTGPTHFLRGFLYAKKQLIPRRASLTVRAGSWKNARLRPLPALESQSAKCEMKNCGMPASRA